MSIKLMSAIFETEMRDLPYTKDGKEHNAKASTVKLLLLALADHANDYGEAFPGYTRLELKTSLSRQGISDTLEAMKQNGLLSIGDEPSRLGTNNYTINIRSFPRMSEEIEQLPKLVKPLDHNQSSHLTTPVKPLDHNHQLTIIEPINNNKENPDNCNAVFSDKEIDDNTALLIRLYQTNIGMIVPLLSEKLIDAARTWPAHLYAPAFEAAVAKNARNWAFVEACIRNAADGKEYQPKRTSYTPKSPKTSQRLPSGL